MSVKSSTLRSSEPEHGLVLGSQGSVPQGGQAEQPGFPSIEEIAAVEVPGETEPRLQKRTLLVDSLIRECKCDLSSDEFLKAVRYAGPLVTVRRPTPEESVFDATPGYFAIHLKSLENGFRFPLESLVTDFFKYFDFLPCQLVPNSHRYLAGFLIRCEIMIAAPDRTKLFKSKPRSESSQERPPLPTSTPSAEHAQASKKHKDVSSSMEGASLSGARSPPSRSVDCGNPTFVKVAFPLKPSFLHGDYEPRRFLQSFIHPPDRMEISSAATEDLASTHLLELGSVGVLRSSPQLVERFEWYVAEKAKGEEELRRLQEHVAGLEGKLADAEERARAAEQARITAEEKARRLDEEAEHRLLFKEGQANYSMGLHRAQEVLLERIRDGKELLKPCENPEEFDSSIYYSEDEDAAGGVLEAERLLTECLRSPMRGRAHAWARLAKDMLDSSRRLTEDERGTSGYGLRSASLPGGAPSAKVRPSSGKNVRVWPALGLPPEEERQARVSDLHPGRTSGYGLRSAFLLRRNAEHECLTFIREEHPGMVCPRPSPGEERRARVFDLHPGRTSGYGLRSAFLLRRNAEHECLTFILEEHPGMVCVRPSPGEERRARVFDLHPGRTSGYSLRSAFPWGGGPSTSV
ncbi:unnamed protein product [Cuscuta campestris]|uniref:Uncharacterized protein n=1 Tax=Cuscuta campestris TaxID=132261 RepID=A0A484L4W2_9ASTE|nr:unnamed protein product [Cuscuta campestris]